MGIPRVSVLTGFDPINQVTPFTYRDNDTHLTILRLLEQYVRDLADHVNASDAANNSAINKAIANLNLLLQQMWADFNKRLDEIGEDNLADDPTTGQRNVSVSDVIGHVYDNARIFAYFAKQYDDLNLSCADFDAIGYSARHFDLAPLYPTVNDDPAELGFTPGVTETTVGYDTDGTPYVI